MNASVDAPDFKVGSDTVADRILENATGEYRKKAFRPDGTAEPAPTPLQVAAMLRAMSDLTLNHLMLSETVEQLGDEKISDPQFRHADGLGRLMHLIADDIEETTRQKRFELENGGIS